MVTPVWKNPGEHLLFANWAYVHVCRYRGWGGTSERRVGSRGSLKRNQGGQE